MKKLIFLSAIIFLCAVGNAEAQKVDKKAMKAEAARLDSTLDFSRVSAWGVKSSPNPGPSNRTRLLACGPRSFTTDPIYM